MLAATAAVTVPMMAPACGAPGRVPSARMSTRPTSRENTRTAHATPNTVYAWAEQWRLTSCMDTHSTPSMNESAMFTSAMASPVRCPGKAESVNMPAATTMISMRQSSEKLRRRPRAMAHHTTNAESAATPSWCTARRPALMGTGSPAGKPREMPSAKPNTASPPRMTSAVERGSAS